MKIPSIAWGKDSTATTLVLVWDQIEPKGANPKEKTGAFQLPKLRTKPGKWLDGLEKHLSHSKHFTGKKNQTSLLRYYSQDGFENLLLLGAGERSKFDSEVARQMGASVRNIQQKEKLLSVSLDVESVAGGKSLDPYTLQAFCEGYLLATYRYDELKKISEEMFFPNGLILIGQKNAKLESAVRDATINIRAVNLARNLGDKPANHLTPNLFAKIASDVAKQHGMKCQVLGRAAMEKEKMGLFLGVANGSIEEPKLVIIDYQGGKKGERPIALVGKGVTFDSGGISIKPSAAMDEMKYDMMGAAVVLGAMQAISERKLPINVMGYIAATENLPSGTAQKPGDIQRSLSGKTVEITNTDAEGRLILADTLEYAQKQDPQAILDFATLTGAVLYALGKVTAGIMGNHKELIERIKLAAEITSERVWELPLYDEYLDDMKSPYADLRNSGNREAGSSKGGVFLKAFVDDKTPWVHFDIAGVAWDRANSAYYPPKLATGAMVRLVMSLLSTWKPIKS